MYVLTDKKHFVDNKLMENLEPSEQQPGARADSAERREGTMGRGGMEKSATNICGVSREFTEPMRWKPLSNQVPRVFSAHILPRHVNIRSRSLAPQSSHEITDETRRGQKLKEGREKSSGSSSVLDDQPSICACLHDAVPLIQPCHHLSFALPYQTCQPRDHRPETRQNSHRSLTRQTARPHRPRCRHLRLLTTTQQQTPRLFSTMRRRKSMCRSWRRS